MGGIGGNGGDVDAQDSDEAEDELQDDHDDMDLTVTRGAPRDSSMPQYDDTSFNSVQHHSSSFNIIQQCANRIHGQMR